MDNIGFKENVDKYKVNNLDDKESVIEKTKSPFLSKLSKIDISKSFKKLGGIKIVLPIVLLFLIVSVYYALFSNDSSVDGVAISYTSSMDYCRELEEKLCKVLGAVEGVGNVNVMVTLESGPELKIATQIDEKTNTNTNSNGTTTSVTIVEEPIIVTQKGEEQPLVLMEILPVVKGVVVVAEGAKDVRVRLDLLEAVQALLGLSGTNIQILTGV